MSACRCLVLAICQQFQAAGAWLTPGTHVSVRRAVCQELTLRQQHGIADKQPVLDQTINLPCRCTDRNAQRQALVRINRQISKVFSCLQQQLILQSLSDTHTQQATLGMEWFLQMYWSYQQGPCQEEGC